MSPSGNRRPSTPFPHSSARRSSARGALTARRRPAAGVLPPAKDAAGRRLFPWQMIAMIQRDESVATFHREHALWHLHGLTELPAQYGEVKKIVGKCKQYASHQVRKVMP